jgi:hypothetical protein
MARLPGYTYYDAATPGVTWTGLTERARTAVSGFGNDGFSVASSDIRQARRPLDQRRYPSDVTKSTAAIVVSFNPDVAPGAYTLSAAAGSYLVTGAAATPRHGWLTALAAGSYALTGTTAVVRLGRMVAALNSSYAMTGTPATIGAPVSRSLPPRNPTAFLPFLVR